MRIGLVHILPVFFLRRDIWPSPALPQLRVRRPLVPRPQHFVCRVGGIAQSC